MNKKPKILIVTWFHCLRNIKSVLALWQKDYELELLTKYNGFNLLHELQFDTIYKGIRFWDTPSQLEAGLRDSDADVIWCHNEPDLMAELALAKDIKKDRVVIHDCHDLPTLHEKVSDVRHKEMATQEKFVIENADWIIVPTDAYKGIIKEKYNKKDNVHTLLSCAPEIFFPTTDLPRVNGMLYCGQVNVPEMNSQLHYRDCLPLFQILTSMNVATHLYNTTPSANLQPYQMAGACIYGTLRMFAAIHQYTRYDYGFVGSNVDCKEIQLCMPNKLFDCIAAGIPLVNLNAAEVDKFIQKHDIGVCVQGFENLSKVEWFNFELWEEKRKKVREIRHQYTAEKEVTKILKIIGIE